jgi:hypothetical protein
MSKVGAMIYKAQNCKKFNSTKLTIFTLACKTYFEALKYAQSFPISFLKYKNVKNTIPQKIWFSQRCVKTCQNDMNQ